MSTLAQMKAATQFKVEPIAERGVSEDWNQFTVDCAGCTAGVSIFTITNYDETKPVYCSDRCQKRHTDTERVARANAPMIKPQPKSQKVDGWDV